MVVGMGLVPVVPILLLPFVLVFFVIVFPIWGLALGVLGFFLIVIRGLNALVKKLGSDALEGATLGMEKSFRWVLTFGGFAERKKPE